MNARKAKATGDCRLALDCTTHQLRYSGSSSTGSSFSTPVASSRLTAWRVSRAMPRPAITHSRWASAEATSRVWVKCTRLSLKYSSQALRVPEPCSRTSRV
ncbi:hypothetical protein D9M73_228990 [compost metagenome]